MLVLVFAIGLLALVGLSVFLIMRRVNENAKEEQSFDKILPKMIEELQKVQQAQTMSLSEHLMRSFDILRGQIESTLRQNAEKTDQQVEKLTQQTDQRLKEITGQVEKRLTEGFEKTTATFQDVLKRLSLIDEAQKRINELSTNVVSLQEILADKRSRGAFGEVQLSALVRNVIPEQHLSFQHSFSTGARADCVLFLPEPTGTIAIDAKFPLENYRRMTDLTKIELEREEARKQFIKDLKKHIQDVGTKYIIPNETADGAMLFIPAEAVFAEIHAHHPEIVEEAQKQKVWLASPTTLMAILTTARAVIKDDATRKQIHIIREHLSFLGKDFERFQVRMDNLSRHIAQASTDLSEVHTSAKKITSQFQKIERVELEHIETLALLAENSDK